MLHSIFGRRGFNTFRFKDIGWIILTGWLGVFREKVNVNSSLLLLPNINVQSKQNGE